MFCVAPGLCCVLGKTYVTLHGTVQTTVRLVSQLEIDSDVWAFYCSVSFSKYTLFKKSKDTNVPIRWVKSEESSNMFLSPTQGSRSRWPPSKAMSSSATTCPSLPFRVVWMRSRCPSARCRGTACCFTRGSQPTTSTCPWGMELCGWSSTWALVPLKPLWNLPAENLMTTSGMMCEWRGTSVRCVYVRQLYFSCQLLTGQIYICKMGGCDVYFSIPFK